MSRHDYAVVVVGTVITFECGRAGHLYKKDFSMAPAHKRLPAWWCARMLTYWSRANGGVFSMTRTRTGWRPDCPKCRKEG